MAAINLVSWHIRMGMGHEHHLPLPITDVHEFCTVILTACSCGLLAYLVLIIKEKKTAWLVDSGGGGGGELGK